MSDTTHAPTSWQRVAENPPRRPRLGPRHPALGRALNVLLTGCAGICVMTMMLDVYGIVRFAGWRADPSSIVLADGQHFDSVSAMLHGLWLLAVLITGACTMTWLFQAYGSREADPDLLTYKRWWVIGGWLIPFILLVRPFQVVRDLHLATRAQPQDPYGARVRCPAHFRWWWGCLMFGNLLSNIGATLMRGRPGLGQLQAALTVDLLSQLSILAAAVLFMGVLRSITRNLWRRSRMELPQSEKWSSESTATATNTSVR
jgi:hypothetical protein